MLCVRFKSEVVACGVVYAAARRFQVPLPQNPPWWKAFDAEKSGIDEVCMFLAHLYRLPKVQYIPVCKDRGSFTFSNNKSLESKSRSIAKDVPQSCSPANIDTSVLKRARGESNIASIGSKGALIKLATDKLKDARKSEDESKGMAAEGEAKDEPTLKSKSDHKMDASGESRRERERERERDRDRDQDRDRTKSWDRDWGKDFDKERELEEAERDKLKDHRHRSRERATDSDRDYYGSSYPSREKDRHRHH